VRGRTIVFLGPTLRPEEAPKCLDAIYRPPAEQGDIVRAVHDLGADAIVLIDGVFAKAPAVRHKEILWALDRGVPVYGAASMGALRASELHSYGMQGHGLIYRWYRATALADDDEVAVAMMPSELGAAALSEALIDIRLTLRLAERRHFITNELRRSLEDLARALHFVDRTYPHLFDTSFQTLPSRVHPAIATLRSWVEGHAVRQKREDALSLLRYLAKAPSPIRKPPVGPPFRMTESWAADLDAAGLFWDNIL
jgi:hypothetical protein